MLLAVWFDPDSNHWDSTYFGKYHEEIESLGFTEKQEQNKVELKFEVGQANPPEVKEVGQRMVFRNPQVQSAIVLAEHYVSFHKLAPYYSWAQLMNEIVDPAYQLYQKIGLGKNIREVQCLYVNRFLFEANKPVSGFFTFLPRLEEEGVLEGVTYSSKYRLSQHVTASIELNGAKRQDNRTEVFLQCSTFAQSFQNEQLADLATLAHDQANKLYNQIVEKGATYSN